ncbi:MAG TPA: recombinase RecF [Phycisphaerales bacterium]|nr:recombinase RecF [Phycisphaerales bacterium]
MGNALDKITIRGFKSIKSLEDFELKNLNIMIGGNGAGKSNFIDFFRMLREMVNLNFAGFIMGRGGADGFMFNGPKTTKNIEAKFKFGVNSYSFKLSPTISEIPVFVIAEEEYGYINKQYRIGSGSLESNLASRKDESSSIYSGYKGVGYYVHESISNWVVYHFHDTSATAPMRRSEITADNERLRSDASNIAPFLLELRRAKPEAYAEIVEAIKLVTPFFDDFILKPKQNGEKEKVNLSWKQKGSDYPMQPYHFSDGTIRFICLATALLQPNLPSTIIIDEPELGLHPYAIEILAELIKAASQKTQVVVSTQSPALIDNFNPEDIIVVNRENGASTFKRLDAKELSHWLEEYSLGELWRKNIVTGGPVRE